MRRALIMLGLLSVAALASCSIKEELQPESVVPSFRGTIEQLVPDASTKAFARYDSEVGKYHIYWNADDRVSIFEEKTYNREYRFLGKDGAASGAFERVGTDPSHIAEDLITTGYQYAIYPYDDMFNLCEEDGTLAILIPAEQEYYDDPRGVGARMLMVARDKEGDFGFKHVGAYVGVTLKGEGVSVKTISFRGNNAEILAGDPLVTFSDDDEPIVAFDSTSPYNSTEITMSFDEPVALTSEEQEFWLVVPAITLTQGYTLTVTDANGGTFQKKTTSSFKLERKKLYHNRATVVTSISVSDVTLDKSELTMTEGETATLTATVLPDNATDKSVTWGTSDETVAKVENGVVTAVGPGTATITVTTTDGGKMATCAVTVKEKVIPVTSVSLDKAAFDLYVGDAAVALVATVSPDNATNKSVTWGTSDETVATVENGVVSAVGPGTATITVTTVDGGETATCDVTVKVHVSSVSLDKGTLELVVGGDPVTLTATVAPDNATDKSVTWSTSNADVAKVENGVVTAVGPGTATITVTTTDGGKEATCEVTVKMITYSLAITPAEDATVDVGATLDFKLKLITITNGEPNDGDDITTYATWSSNKSEYATIGEHTGIAAGVKELLGDKVTITATFTPEGYTKPLEISVPLTVNKASNHPGDPTPIGDDTF